MKNKKIMGIMMSLLLSTGVIAGCGTASTGGSGKDSKTIVIGENLELSGAVASYGSSADKGIALALEEINKKGIDGKKLKIVKVDNKSDAQEATSAALKLISQDKVSAIIGAATSGDTLAQVKIVDDKKVPLITTSGTASNITYDKGKLNEFVFRTCFIDPFQGIVSANFASNNLKVKNAAIFIDSSSDYAKGLASNFKDTFTKNGGKIVKEEAYLAKDTDFRAQLTNIKAKNPDVIFVPGYYEEVGLIVKQARDLGTSAFAHDIYGQIIKKGNVTEKQQMKAARYASVGVAILSILLALIAQKMNVAFLVSLAFCVAASANLPVIIFTIYWKKFNTAGAVTGMLCGLLSSLILVIISPNVFSPVEGAAIFIGKPLIDLTNPAIISVPLGFIGAYIGTVASKKQDVKRFAEVSVKANTGYRENDI